MLRIVRPADTYLLHVAWSSTMTMCERFNSATGQLKNQAIGSRIPGSSNTGDIHPFGESAPSTERQPPGERRGPA
jgi:hypothetical protein